MQKNLNFRTRKIITISLIWIVLLSQFALPAQAHGNHNHNQPAKIFNELIVLEVTKEGPQIKKLNVNSGNSQVLYNIPKGDKLFQFEPSPNKPELIMSYMQQSSGMQGLWTLNYADIQKPEAAKLTPLLVDTDPNSWYFDPLYDYHSDDIYFVSANVDKKTGRASKDLTLTRMTLTDNTKTIIAKNASYPTISERGNFLSWVEDIDAGKTITILEHGSQKIRQVALPNNKLKVRFSQVNEDQNSLIFFTDKEDLISKYSHGFSLFEFSGFDFSDLDFSLFNKAYAHTGHKHHDFFGWQLDLADGQLKHSRKIWLVENIRAFDIAPDGKQAAYISPNGLKIVELNSKRTLLNIPNPNFWKLRWATVQHQH